jgi:hypothetical protein
VLAAQVPGAPVRVLRPEQRSPLVQVPPPVPQHGCPVLPQLAQVSLVAPMTQSWGAVQALTPPSTAGPKTAAVGQHVWSVPPQAAQVPGVVVVRSRPVHRKPALQVPVLVVPQHDAPEVPQVEEHVSPLAPSMHDRPVLQVVAPPPSPPPAQHCSWSAPHALQVPAFPCPALRPEQA